MMWDKEIYNRNGYGAAPIVFVLIPLISIGGFLLFSYTRSTQTSEIKAIAIKERSSQDDLSIDADQDGIKDWEEEIYTTNPHNPDTDGDGIKDGDEITQNRDPLKPGPDDYFTKKDTSLSSPSLTDNGEPQNLTKKLAEVFGTDYLVDLVQNPQSPPDVDTIADKMAQIALEQQSSSTPFITASDIIISRNATTSDMAHYINRFNAIILNSLKPLLNTKSIQDTLTNIVHTEDTARTSAAMDQLTNYIDAYNQFLVYIKVISVPKNFVSLHLDYLNTAIKEREALKKIQNIKHDPMTTLVGFREFMDTTTKFNDLQRQYIDLENTIGLIPAHK